MCADCGACEAACPLGKPLERYRTDFEPRYYAAKAASAGARTDSHAGGVFFVLARQVIARGGTVYGCAFDDNRHPHHIRADSLDALEKMRGLKPVQSDTDGIFAAVREDLEGGRTVLFSGTPCQCDGLREYLGVDYPNLFTVDMLCSGVTSEGVFHRYVYWQEQRLGGRLTDLRFENKRAFGHSPGMRVVFKRGRFRYLLSYPAQLDALMAMCQSGAIHRRACGECPYACAQRVGDLSLGRFVNIRRAHPDFPYDGGASLVIVSTAKGAQLFDDAAGEMVTQPSDFARASANRRLVAPIRQSRYRKKLLSDIFREGFGAAAEKFGRVGLLGAAVIFIRCLIPDRAVICFDRVVRRMRGALGR